MAKIIAITNQKGGVGKTTSCINLAASLAACKRRVLLIDLDPQGNATMGSGVDKNNLDISVNDILLGQVMLSDAIVRSSAQYDVVPANSDLTQAEIQLLGLTKRETRLKTAIEKIKEGYDFIFIDCPPALNILTVNALVAADSIIIPMQCEYYALEGLSSLMDTVRQLRATLNPDLSVEGILRTMYDSRNRLTNDVSAQLFEHFSEKVYNTVIPRNVRLAEAPSHGLPAIIYDKRSAGALAYIALAGEIIRRHEKEMVGRQACQQKSVV